MRNPGSVAGRSGPLHGTVRRSVRPLSSRLSFIVLKML
jgi:hypothetical protein